MAKSEEPLFFATPARFRAWLSAHHATAAEQWIGFYKKGSGRPSITWPEAVDEVLCVGWIDGIRKGIDDVSYKIRFTPRKASSTWSAVNIARVAELTQQRRMRPAGLEAFARRVGARSGIYAYEQRGEAAFSPEFEQIFRAHEQAWEFFQAQPASDKKTAIWRVVSAKKEPTRRRRLEQLIEDAAAGRRIREPRRESKS